MRWHKFEAQDNPWSHSPALGYRAESSSWVILFRPDRPWLVAGLVRNAKGTHSYFIRYDDGTLGWDSPERIPKAIRRTTEQLAAQVALTLTLKA